jgi:hypothetical protein
MYRVRVFGDVKIALNDAVRVRRGTATPRHS